MRARQTGQGPVVAVLGHYGNRNLGDEAIIAAMMAGLRRHVGLVAPVAVSLDPADSAGRHGVRAFPLRRTARSGPIDPAATETAAEPAPRAAGANSGRVPRRLPRPLRRLGRAGQSTLAEGRFLLRVIRFLRGVDLVAITGSNQFLDNFGGFGGFPWTLLKWSVLARLCGCRLAVVAVGAGPLQGRISRACARVVVRLAQEVSFRDEASRRLVLGRRRTSARVCPDLAFSLPLLRAPARERVERVAINPMPVFDARYWPDADAARYARFVAAMAELVRRVRAQGLQPVLFPTQPSDLRVIEDIEARLAADGGETVIVERPETVDELLGVLERADLVVPTRFHGTVLALRAGRPVVSICYHRKTADVLATFGLESEGFVIDELDPVIVAEHVRTVARRAAAMRATIETVDARHECALEDEFARLAALAWSRRTPAGSAREVRS